MRMPLPVHNNRGTSLIELMLASAIMMVGMLGFYQLLSSFFESYRLQDAIAEIQQQGRVAMGLIRMDVKRSGYDPTGLGFTTADACLPTLAPVLEATPTSFHYLSDQNEDGNFFYADTSNACHQDSGENVRYEWIGPTGLDLAGQPHRALSLYRDSGGGLQEVAANLSDLQWTYFDEEGTQFPVQSLSSSEQAEVKVVGVSFQSESASLVPLYGTENETIVRPYTLKINLRNR